MNHLDLFSGIGGFSYAAQQVWGKEHNIVAFVEQDKYCQKVLNKHWPDVPIHSDIREYKYEDVAHTESNGSARKLRNIPCENEEITEPKKQHKDKTELFINGGKNGRVEKIRTVDLLTGGFPCQPFSVAGKRKGKADNRYLWPEMFRIIQEAKPTWIIGENVPGIINMGLETTVLDLEREGYEVELLVLPACGVGACHQRYRVWIVAWNANCGRGNKGKVSEVQKREDTESSRVCTDVAHGNGEGLQGGSQARNIESQRQDNDKLAPRCSEDSGMWPAEPDVGRVAHGIPSRVDRLKGLGNAIVPQCVMPIMEAIRLITKEGNVPYE